MYGDQLWFRDMADTMREKYGTDYKNISDTAPPKCIITIISWFNPVIRPTLKKWGIMCKIDTTPSKEILGIEHACSRKSLQEMVESLIDHGYFKDLRSGK